MRGAVQRADQGVVRVRVRAHPNPNPNLTLTLTLTLILTLTLTLTKAWIANGWARESLLLFASGWEFMNMNRVVELGSQDRA